MSYSRRPKKGNTKFVNALCICAYIMHVYSMRTHWSHGTRRTRTSRTVACGPTANPRTLHRRRRRVHCRRVHHKCGQPSHMQYIAQYSQLCMLSLSWFDTHKEYCPQTTINCGSKPALSFVNRLRCQVRES